MTERDTGPELMLALDTSGDVCSIATLREGALVAEHTFRHGMHLSERLMRHLDGVLQEADTTLESVDAFAVGIGPGSFTGTRIGVMTLKTFAFLSGAPLYGIDSLEGMAQVYAGLLETVVIPMLPCRSGVVYAGMYAVSSGTPRALEEPGAFTLLELAHAAAPHLRGGALVCGPASVRYAAEVRTALQEVAASVAFGQAMFPRAADLGMLACRRRTAGSPADDALALVPRYISPPPITMPKETGIRTTSRE